VLEKKYIDVPGPGFMADGTKSIMRVGIYYYWLRAPYDEDDTVLSAVFPDTGDELTETRWFQPTLAIWLSARISRRQARRRIDYLLRCGERCGSIITSAEGRARSMRGFWRLAIEKQPARRTRAPRERQHP